MHFVIVIYMACKSLAKWWGLFLGTSHIDLEGWQNNPPVGIFRGVHSPLELHICVYCCHNQPKVGNDFFELISSSDAAEKELSSKSKIVFL